MNTPSENAYHELMSGNRICFKTEVTYNEEYDFQITPQILGDFEDWKVHFLETTDEHPTELDMLEYFKKSGISSCWGDANRNVSVKEIKIIDLEDGD